MDEKKEYIVIQYKDADDGKVRVKLVSKFRSVSVYVDEMED